MLNIIEQLTFIYENIETWHKIKMSEHEANLYHERLLTQGNILTYVREGLLKGYIEYYRINYEQLGRICCNLQLDHSENILSGKIALINRMYIDPQYRNGEAFDMLSAIFLVKNKDADYFATFQEHKKHKPYQIYTREEILKHYK